MSEHQPQHATHFARFDPRQGCVVREPPGEGRGYWVGAPGVTFDAETSTFWMVYRVRRPRGVHPDRGAVVRLARSDDGIAFTNVWSGRKEQLDSTSIERCAISRLPSGAWALYVSYVDPADGRWRIDLVEADDPSGFDLSKRRAVITAALVETEGVKDPFVFRANDISYMVVSYAEPTKPTPADDLHATYDAYNTGLSRSCSGLATSRDGRNWTWEGGIFIPSESGWDAYCARIGTVWKQDGTWLALYDGSADVSENYEERAGLAQSSDLRSFKRVTRTAPLWKQLGALRYFDVLTLPDARFFYYEMSRPDGSHNLRVFKQARRVKKVVREDAAPRGTAFSASRRATY